MLSSRVKSHSSAFGGILVTDTPPARSEDLAGTNFNIIKKPYLDSVRTVNDAKKIRNELLELSEKIGIKFDYQNLEDIFAQNRNNWGKAQEKTKYYLSW